ncbi:acid-sensing ion channel 1-like [Mytilus trossulus]|uniref:acid-sensing ion channel 1-like n=1 Tax=Mytilus trossulus TaxID=6551 RepID=UPI00300572C9
MYKDICRRFKANEAFVTSQYGISSGLVFKTTSREIQIAIHDPQEDLNMSKDGRTMRNGTETLIEIHRREYISLPSPYIGYGNQICIDETDYSFVDCKRNCYNEMLKKECSCTMDPSPNGDLYHSSTLCVCPPECHVIKYDQILSSVANKNDDDSHFLTIRIYLKDLSTTVTEQVPKYDGVASLLANLGGQMGLFLGASILTITELLEFIICIVWTVIQRRAKGRNAVQNIDI